MDTGDRKPGGEGGIRTPDTGVSPYNGLANRRLQPLGHLSGDFQQFNMPALVHRLCSDPVLGEFTEFTQYL